MHTTTAILSCLLLCSGAPHASETDSVRGKRMQEVEVRARATQTLKDGRDGRLYWQMESLESLPHVLGSSDPVRALQLLPGVATNNDYTSGIRIQGCEASQSLLEMDGAPVFNAAHLLGLFSTFNASHFRGMALVKNRHDAGFPNRLGGRLSFYPVDSVARQIHLDATVSFMESEGTLTLPAGRRSTLYLSGRGSYLNLLYGGLLEVDRMELRYGLQDYNLTFVHQAGERDKLRLSLYHGLDRTRLQQEDFDNRNRADWQNTAAALHWQHHAPRAIFNQSLTFSRYGSKVAMDLNAVGLDLESGILQAGYAGQAEWTTGPVTWKGGAECHYYRIRPMALQADGTFVRNSSPSRNEAGHEASAYLQGRLLLGRRSGSPCLRP